MNREPRDNTIIGLLRERFADAPMLGAEVGVSYGTLSALLLREFPLLNLRMVDRWEQVPHRRLYSDPIATQGKGERTAAMHSAECGTEPFADRRQIVVADSVAAAKQCDDGTL